MITNTTPRIVCAALRHSSGAIICGPRHFDERMIEQIENSRHKDWRQAEQGFVDAWGQFLSREEAWVVALFHGQIYRDRDWFNGLLHSEHLY